MMTDPVRVLVTGFGPFPGVPVNATALLVPQIVARLRQIGPPVRAAGHILPTEWQAGPAEAAGTLARHRPHVVLHFGVAGCARGVVLERRATSACREAQDAVGHLPAADGRLPDGAPAGVCTASLPFEDILTRLAARSIPASLSDDAGAYLCNAVLYQTLASPRVVRPAMAGFVHIPTALAGHGPDGRDPAPDCPIAPDAVVTAAAEIVAACLAASAKRALA